MAEANESVSLTTSQVTELTGATRRQLENWDAKGLIAPERTGHGVANDRRLYDADDIARVRDILLLKELGLGLGEIKAILDAPEEQRRMRMAACTEQLKERYAGLQKKILLSSIAEASGLESVRNEIAAAGSFEVLACSYERDENLRRIVRWWKSHSERDIERFGEELVAVAAEFEALGESAAWSEAEIVIARFCDVWGERLGWPSIGQMLMLHELFSDPSMRTSELEELLGSETMDRMGDLFLLAWASAGLETIDEVLVHLYKAVLDDPQEENEESAILAEAVSNAAEVLCASLCELGGNAHVHSQQAGAQRAQRILAMSDAVLDILVDVALDDELGDYLEVDALDTIDAEAIEMVRSIVEHHMLGELDAWMRDGGAVELRRGADDWRESLAIGWLRWAREDEDSGFCEEEDESVLAEGFSTWFENWFEEAYADPPEATWATEEESCARERAMRELIEQDDDRRGRLRRID